MTRIEGPTAPASHAARDDEAFLERLFEAAGPPPPAPEIDVARIQEAARQQWRRRYAWRRERRRLRWQWASAAAAVVAALALLWSSRTPPVGALPTAPLATAVLVAGDVRVVAPAAHGGGEARRLATGEPVAAGSVVRTGPAAARVALRWSDGRSLRLDRDSELRLAAVDRVELRRGGVYLDSGGAPAAGGPTVATPRGSFREIGTQFEARVLAADAGDVRLRVRRGAVAWRDNGRAETATAGSELTVGGDGRLERGAIPPHGAAWAWVLETAPSPAIEGWTMARFLAWYASESGLAIAYADPASAALAASVVVHGSVASLRPAEALDAVLASGGFTARAEGDRLVVSTPFELP